LIGIYYLFCEKNNVENNGIYHQLIIFHFIGDHKQLRPSNAVYKLAKDFNFDISLFERMVNNEVPCYTLGEQHRMRPEIASLITPSIYNELKNHISVYNREHIRGVSKDMFFLNHNVYENEVCYLIIFHHDII